MAVRGAGYTGSEVATKPAEPGYIYSDLNFYFSPSPFFVGQGISGDVTRVLDANSIRQSLRTIVLTSNYERPYNPFFGCNIRSFLFEPMDAWERYELNEILREQIRRYEPRVEITDVRITQDVKKQEVQVELDYIIKGIEGSSNTDTTKIQINTERVR